MPKIVRCLLLSALSGVLSACQSIDVVRPETGPAAIPTASVSGKTALLDFRIAKSQPAGNLNELQLGTGHLYYLATPLLSRADLAYVLPMRNSQGQPFLRFTLTEDGAKKLEAITQRHRGDWLLFSIDDNFIAAARIIGAAAQGILDIAVDSEQRALYVVSKVGETP